MQIVQINLNKSKRAQDLMMQYMRENKIGIALISELNGIPRGNWFGEAYGMAAIHWVSMSPAPSWGEGGGMLRWKAKEVS